MVLSSCTKYVDLNGEVHSMEDNEVSDSNLLLGEQCRVAIFLGWDVLLRIVGCKGTVCSGN